MTTQTKVPNQQAVERAFAAYAEAAIADFTNSDSRRAEALAQAHEYVRQQMRTGEIPELGYYHRVMSLISETYMELALQAAEAQDYRRMDFCMGQSDTFQTIAGLTSPDTPVKADTLAGEEGPDDAGSHHEPTVPAATLRRPAAKSVTRRTTITAKPTSPTPAVGHPDGTRLSRSALRKANNAAWTEVLKTRQPVA